MKELLEKLVRRFSIKESSIDFPQRDLDPFVWMKEDDTYKIRPGVKRKILDTLAKFPDLVDMAVKNELNLPTIHIVGSIATNQWKEDSDIDVHVVIGKDSDYYSDEDFQDEVANWFNEHRDEIKGYIKKHPIEVYIQYDPNQDLLSAGCYDLMSDKWLSGPRIVPPDYDPYEDFSHIADDLRATVEDADKLLGELKRDVIDYDVIKSAMKQLEPEQKETFLKKLKNKLEEIEKDISVLYKKRKEWVDARRKASKPSTPEEALEDIELAKRWEDQNALFKFINRYHYLRTIKDLEALLSDDNEITPDEVDVIKNLIGIRRSG